MLKLLFIFYLLPPFIDGFCGGSDDNPMNSTQDFDFEFIIELVKSEVIVKFAAFYSNQARKSYIQAALKGKSGFQILPRTNLMADFPSDFDVVRLDENQAEIISTQLLNHPCIKSVSTQRKVIRSLKNLRTRKSLTLPNSAAFWQSTGRHSSRRLLRTVPRQITATMQADILWERGVTGSGVRVAIFDTGLSKTHPHFKRIRERTNWTNEKTLDDELGHGTFVAGVIASSTECLGFAPDAELHIFRVFTILYVELGLGIYRKY